MEDNIDMLVVTSDTIEGKNIEALGLVQGSTVRSRNIGSDFLAGLKNVVGGELVGYSKLLHRAREQAYGRMIEEAVSKGADAIVCFRFQSSTVAQGASAVSYTHLTLPTKRIV